MPDIMHTLTIKAPAEKVYQALTEQKDLAAWWATEAAAQAKVGSLLVFKLGAALKVKLTKLEPGRNVTWLVTEGIPGWDNTEISWELETVSNGTMLRMAHRNFAPNYELFVYVNTAWAWHIFSLKDYVETGKGRPGPAPI